MALDEAGAPALTEDEELARRLCALAVAFSNARSPIGTGEVRETYYPDLQEDSFRRKFARDRERLAEGGLHIMQVGVADNEALWQANGSSFADGSTVSPEDALVLDVLCSQLVEDPSFAYRNELRFALAKIDRAFGGLTAVRLEPAARRADASLSTLVACKTNSVLARVLYVDAKGNRSERLVAPYGTFSLRGRTYFVCALAEGKQVCEPPRMRTLRTDRFERVKATSIPFVRPDDFSIDDHILLPFQIGPSTMMATFEETRTTERDALAEMHRRARLVEDEPEHRVWEVAVSDEAVAAAWTVASGVLPRSPASLVAAYETLLQGAAETPYDPELSAETPTPTPRRTGRRGRPGAMEETRALLALVGSLTSEGDVLTVDGVSSRLGVTTERAKRLLELVLTACSGSSYQLPLQLADDDALMLSRSRGVTGKPIRLTRLETEAIIAALDVLCLSDDNPLRHDVLEAFAPTQLTEHVARARVDEMMAFERSEMLEACSRAIVAKACLTFSYQGLDQDVPTERRVAPREVRHELNAWYLDAFDLDRRALRTFRVDRMQNMRVTALDPDGIREDEGFLSKGSPITVAFGDRAILEALEWPKLEVAGERDGCVVTTIPYYGGSWLPRHLAACGGRVVVGDEEVAKAVRTEASRVLGELAKH